MDLRLRQFRQLLSELSTLNPDNDDARKTWVLRCHQFGFWSIWIKAVKAARQIAQNWSYSQDQFVTTRNEMFEDYGLNMLLNRGFRL